ncbi:enoyl-CoA hydratase/isomerase family protein, partial [Pseudomonas sp. ATCC 13867]
VRRCAPGANAATKALLLGHRKRRPSAVARTRPRDQFAAAVTGAEGAEGTLAFVQKRKPNWAQ